jgi:hypothetical protein
MEDVSKSAPGQPATAVAAAPAPTAAVKPRRRGRQIPLRVRPAPPAPPKANSLSLTAVASMSEDQASMWIKLARWVSRAVCRLGRSAGALRRFGEKPPRRQTADIPHRMPGSWVA